MFRRILSAAVAVLSLIALEGCVTKQSLPDLPPALGEKGLLVARLYVLGMQAMEDANVNIDGKFIASGLRDGYLAIPLDPGEHKLIQLRAQGRLLSGNLADDNSPFRKVKGGGGGGGGKGGSYIYVPGGSYTINYTSLAVDRSFRIEPGKVTNLGLIIYIPVLDDPNKKRATVNESREFNVVSLDNSAEINRFLDANYPELVSTIKDRELILAPAKYLEAKYLPELRRTIAYYESRGPRRIFSPTKTAVYGRAGTVAIVKRAAAGEKPGPADVQILDTGTLADIVGAARNGEQFTFLTSEAKLLSVDGGKLSETPLPFRVHPVGLHSLGEGGLVAVDNHMRILTTQAPGAKWVSYEGAMVKSPRSDVDMVSDSEGVYIGLGYRGFPDSLHYLKAGESSPRTLSSPEQRTGISNLDFHYLVARDKGLYMMFVNKPDFYFWSKAKQRWALHSMPQGKCKPVKFDDKDQDLTVECDGIGYSSNNSGATWTKSAI